MGADKVLHGGGQVVLLGQLQTGAHMLYDDGGAFRVLQLVVGVEIAVLVLCKVERGFNLAYIVIQGTHFGQQGVAANLVNQVLAYIGHLH